LEAYPVSSERDIIGPWTEVKLDVLRDYAQPYSRILTSQGFHHSYIDAYAASGEHISRTTGEVVPGSPLIALQTNPPFREYHFIDKDPDRVEQLRQATANRKDVFIHHGDCNRILLDAVFPRIQYENRKRAFCLLDPYNIDLSWDVIAAAGATGTIEIFVNFMVMDMNMNVLLRELARAKPAQIDRMNRFWGDDSWQKATHEPDRQGHFFAEQPETVKVEGANTQIAAAYRKRLIEVAGFAYAAEPLAFKNSLGATIYYLFFASPKATGEKIVEDIFRKHRGA
jgi:three-Cys-motif partner protein